MIWKLNIHIFPSPLESNQSKSENTLVFSGCNYIRVFLKVGKAFKYTLCLHYKLKHQKINKYIFCFQIAPKYIYIYIYIGSLEHFSRAILHLSLFTTILCLSAFVLINLSMLWFCILMSWVGCWSWFSSQGLHWNTHVQ